MNKSIQTQVYKRLIDDITALYDVAHHALVEAYLPGCHTYEKIASQGHFLNQELLNKGLAQPWRS